MVKKEKKPENEKLNFETGEIETIAMPELNKVIDVYTVRSNGSLRVQQDFKNCPTRTEQHTAHLTDINYLVEKYTPDEFAAYLAQRSQFRQEIQGHDFSAELTLQEARNAVYNSKKAYDALPKNVRNEFNSHLDFVKFADVDSNAQTLVDLKLVTPEQLQSILISDRPRSLTPQPQPSITPPPTTNSTPNTPT